MASCWIASTRLTGVLAARGLVRGDRVALLSRNRPEYLEIELAAANLGVITACLNWRLSARELAYCVELVSPKLLIAEQDLTAQLGTRGAGGPANDPDRPEYEHLLQQAGAHAAPIAIDPEDGLVILYTSGTTGLPKGARDLCHRAMIARALVFSSELGHLAARQFRRLGADVSYGVDRSQPCNPAARRHGRHDRRLSGRAAVWPPVSATTSAGCVLIPGMVEAFAAGFRAQATR